MSVLGLLVVVASALGAVPLVACRTVEVQDPDREPQLARRLPLDEWRFDTLDCREQDCIDWYRFEIAGEGELLIEVTASSDVYPPQQFTVYLADEHEFLLEEPSRGRTSLALARPAQPGVYHVAVAPQDPEQPGALRYELRAAYEPPPPPPPPVAAPPPRIETITSKLLEVEGSPEEPRAVLIEHGRSSGMRPGLEGRLLEGERVIATIEIVGVYEEGSRARVVERLSGPITPETRVEIDLPEERPLGTAEEPTALPSEGAEPQ